MELILEAVSKSYDRPVLKEISCRFEGGKLYVIKGVSGCGKSTLLNILGGVEKEFEGKIVRSPEKLHSAYIFQRSLLLSTLTVRENLELIRHDKEAVTAQAGALGIADLLDKLPGTLSGGERQRAAIERALLRDPRLLLADEPTASLDDENSRKIAEKIAALKADDRIVIVATHEDYFDEAADEIWRLDYGVLQPCPPRENAGPCLPPGMREEVPEQPPRAKHEVQGLQSNQLCEGREGRAEESFLASRPLPSPSATPSPALRGRGQGGPAHSRSRKFFPSLTYVFKRRPGLLKLKNLFLTGLFFLIILLGSALQKNVTEEAIRLYRKDRPVDLIELQPSVVASMSEKTKSRLTIYDCYFAEEGEVTAYYLLPKEYSVLGTAGALSYGRFPEKETEVLVNISLATVLSGDPEHPENCLGQDFSFCGLKLSVSGIVSNEGYRGDFRNDWYYAYGKDNRPLRAEDQHLFLAYSLLQTIGTKKESYGGIVMASAPGIWNDEDLQDRLKYNDSDSLNRYLQYIRQLKAQTDFYVRIAFIVLLALFFIACLYTVSVIRLELFYRRRELGYLQIFGLSKGRIRRLILLEYTVKMLGSLLLAVLVYLLLAAVYALSLGGSFPLPDPVQLGRMIGVLALMHLLTVWLSAVVFLRRSITRLITT
ncbi:MAG: ATP-binding cassette domain-containing protein [Lachnospiraceae bacterium]|nr:ATP-binding cassette domain-containing protein [Lachnospiraceae bacterium]